MTGTGDAGAASPHNGRDRLHVMLHHLLVALLIFSVFGFVVVPLAVKHIAQWQLQEQLGRRVELKHVRANPFALSLTLRDLQVFEPDGRTPFAGLARLYLNAELSSLFRRAPVLRAIQLDSPRARLIRFKDSVAARASGPYNFSDIVARRTRKPGSAAVEASDKPGGKPPRFSLNNIQIADGAFTLEDRAVGETHEISELDLQLPFISTLPVHVDTYLQPGLRMRIDGAPFVVGGRTRLFQESRETIALLRIDNLDLTRIVRHVPLPVAFQVGSGRLDAALDVSFVRSGREVPKLLVKGRVALTKLALQHKSGAALLGLQQLEVLVRRADVLAQRSELERIKVQGLRVHGRRRADGSIDVQALFPPSRPVARAAVRAAEKAKVAPQARIEEVALEDLALLVGAEAAVRLQSCGLRGIAVDLGEHTAAIDEVNTQGGDLRVARNRAGVIDLATIGAGIPAVEPEGAGVRQSPARPWTLTLGRLAVAQWSLRLQDQSVQPEAILVVAPIDIQASNLSTAPGTRGTVDVKLGLAGNGLAAAAGTVALQPLDASLQLRLRGVELLPLQPYFAEQLNLLVTAGRVSSTAKLGISAPAGQQQPAAPPRVQFDGSIDVDGFASIDGRSRESFLKWRSLHVGGLSLRTEPLPLVVTIKEIALKNYFSRLFIHPDGRFNLQDVLRPPQPGAATPGRGEPAPTPAIPPPKARPPQIKVGKVSLQGGSVSFTDRTIRPPYTVALTGFGGRITGLSSSAGTQATMDLRGKVDDAGGLAIAGTLNPLAKDLFVDLKVDLTGFELSPTSPYAGKYAGYGVSKGKLALSLGYLVQNRQLKARNHITLDQFDFGSQVASPTATKLPVKLAVTLLRDRHGVIDVDLPISGSLDDPKFKLWPAILKALGTLIAKAATAPFSILASSFGGDDDEQAAVAFPPGEATLDTKAQEKVRALAVALRDHPALAFEVEGGADPKTDPEGLKRAGVERKLREQKVLELVKSGTPVADPDQVSIESGERARLLKKAYKAEDMSKPRNLIGMTKDLPEAEMEKLLLAHIPTDEPALRALADKRAAVVRDALAKLEPAGVSRAFLVAPKVATPAAGPANRVELRLKK